MVGDDTALHRSYFERGGGGVQPGGRPHVGHIVAISHAMRQNLTDFWQF